MSRKKVQFGKSAVEVCKMPWFLIEVVPPPLAGQFNSNGRRDHYIVHSVDICDKLSKNMYVDGNVKFEHNNTVLDGKVIIATENRTWIERELPKYSGTANEKLRSQRMYTALFSTEMDNFIISILPECHINILPSVPFRPLEAVLTANEELVKATVLHIADDKVISDSVLESLKLECFETGFKGVDQATTVPGKDEWMFIQYCSGPSCLIYSILNSKNAHWTKENLYRDVVVYFKLEEIVYQGIILHKSSNYNELVDLLQAVKKGVREYFYPEQGKVPEKFVPLDNAIIEKLIKKARQA